MTSASPGKQSCIWLLLFVVFAGDADTVEHGTIDINHYREVVRRMFYHAYDSYIHHAYPYDELRPLTCDGQDTWGSYSLTLIDALDTLAVLGNYSEFRRVSHLLIDKAETFFDMDINVSVFETNIRVVGGLLSAHLLTKRAGMVLEPGWPCSGPLLRMAEHVARKLLPAFDTPTGMPYGTVNLRRGVPPGETTVTCTAGVGTFIIEFATLSRLSGDPVFEKVAMRAIRALWKHRSPIGLLGNHIDVATGKWTALDSGIGGGVDSYFEYLVKGSFMFNIPELLEMFREYEKHIVSHVKRDDWYLWANMKKGGITLPLFTSLDAYWPGIQSMLGDIDGAMKTLHNFQQVWRQFGSTPEFYNIPKAEVHQGREGYPLRPELIESIMYLYRATGDPFLLTAGVDIVEAIERIARTKCGYATVKDVRDHHLENRMESFFLAETTKYLYLLFDPGNFLHNNGSHGSLVHTPGGHCVLDAGGYVFNTEAHPLDLAAVHCCSATKKQEEATLSHFHDNLDLLGLLDLAPDDDKNRGPIVGRKLKRKRAKIRAGRNSEKGEASESGSAYTGGERTGDKVSLQYDASRPQGPGKEDVVASAAGADSFSTQPSSADEEAGTVASPRATVETIVVNTRESSSSEKSSSSSQPSSSSIELSSSSSSAQSSSSSSFQDTSTEKDASAKSPSNLLIKTKNAHKTIIVDPEPRKKTPTATTTTTAAASAVDLAQQILELFSSVSKKPQGGVDEGGGGGREGGQGEGVATMKVPSVTDLYASLANYSASYAQKPWVMRCPALAFHSRLSVWGEMFDSEETLPS